MFFCVVLNRSAGNAKRSVNLMFYNKYLNSRYAGIHGSKCTTRRNSERCTGRSGNLIESLMLSPPPDEEDLSAGYRSRETKLQLESDLVFVHFLQNLKACSRRSPHTVLAKHCILFSNHKR
jgi:hypothetical protein